MLVEHQIDLLERLALAFWNAKPRENKGEEGKSTIDEADLRPQIGIWCIEKVGNAKADDESMSCVRGFQIKGRKSKGYGTYAVATLTRDATL
jgi:hypothetical protein